VGSKAGSCLAPGDAPLGYASGTGLAERFGSWVTPHIGVVPLADLDWQVLTRLYDHLRPQGGRPTKAARVKAAATGRSRSVGRSARGRSSPCTSCCAGRSPTPSRAGLLQVNPADTIPKKQRPTHRPPKAAGKHWEPGESAQFLQASRFDCWHPLWALGLDTGARRRQLLALRWGDVDLEARTVAFSKTGWSSTATSSRARRSPARPAGWTSGPRRWRRCATGGAGSWPTRGRQSSCSPMSSASRSDRSGCTTCSVRRARPRVCRTSGPHGMRHTSATLALKAGVPLHVVSPRLGHPSTMITANLYSHVFRGQQADAAQALAAVYYGTTS
jgi:integrase